MRNDWRSKKCSRCQRYGWQAGKLTEWHVRRPLLEGIERVLDLIQHRAKNGYDLVLDTVDTRILAAFISERGQV